MLPPKPANKVFEIRVNGKPMSIGLSSRSEASLRYRSFGRLHQRYCRIWFPSGTRAHRRDPLTPGGDGKAVKIVGEFATFLPAASD
jgi:hypothetical protein